MMWVRNLGNEHVAVQVGDGDVVSLAPRGYAKIAQVTPALMRLLEQRRVVRSAAPAVVPSGSAVAAIEAAPVVEVAPVAEVVETFSGAIQEGRAVKKVAKKSPRARVRAKVGKKA